VCEIADLVTAFHNASSSGDGSPGVRLIFVEIQGFVALEPARIKRLAQIGRLVRRGIYPPSTGTSTSIPLGLLYFVTRGSARIREPSLPPETLPRKVS